MRSKHIGQKTDLSKAPNVLNRNGNSLCGQLRQVTSVFAIQQNNHFRVQSLNRCLVAGNRKPIVQSKIPTKLRVHITDSHPFRNATYNTCTLDCSRTSSLPTSSLVGIDILGRGRSAKFPPPHSASCLTSLGDQGLIKSQGIAGESKGIFLSVDLVLWLIGLPETSASPQLCIPCKAY